MSPLGSMGSLFWLGSGVAQRGVCVSPAVSLQLPKRKVEGWMEGHSGWTRGGMEESKMRDRKNTFANRK